MEKVRMSRGDKLIVDPCYIKNVTCGEPRFDALRCEKVLYEGDDGEHKVVASNGETLWLGVDSGRIWEMAAEFECEVEVDSGLSGHAIMRAK